MQGKIEKWRERFLVLGSQRGEVTFPREGIVAYLGNYAAQQRFQPVCLVLEKCNYLLVKKEKYDILLLVRD